MTRPFRRTMPNPWFIRVPMAALTIYAILILSLWLRLCLRGMSSSIHWEYVLALTFTVSFQLSVYWLLLFGLYRAFAFNPLFHPDYFKWLSTSCWTHEDPLPNGPMHLAWEDFVIVGVLTLTHYLSATFVEGIKITPARALLLPLVFSLGYLGVNFSNFMLTNRPVAYGIIIPLLLSLYHPSIAVLAAGFVTSLMVCQIGISLLLRRLDLSLKSDIESPLKAIAPNIKLNQNLKIKLTGEVPALGWPHSVLSRKEDRVLIQFWEQTTLSAICAILSGLFIIVLDPDKFRSEEGALSAFLFVLSVFAIIIRLPIYMKAMLPPISFWGRIFTLRPLIPSYDIIFLHPILVVLLNYVFVKSFASFSYFLPEHIVFAIFVFVLSLMTLNCPPRLNRWMLTAKGRLSTPPGNSTSVTYNSERRI